MRYLGSKSSTLASLGAIVGSRFEGGTFADPFGGVGVVGSHFREKGFTVTSSDLLEFPVAFQIANIAVADSCDLQTLVSGIIAEIEAAPRVEGWVTRHYSEERSYFTRENAIAIDSAYSALHQLHADERVPDTTFAYLLASLISSADRVANTAGTYYAHLKKWDRRALKPFAIRPLKVRSGPIGHATTRDALATVRASAYDIVYLDPPYNTRDYAAYYHFPESLANGFAAPSPSGLSGVNRVRIASSRFARRRTATSAMQELLGDVRAKLLLLHYRDDGLIERETLRRSLGKIGRVIEHSVEALGYGTKGTRTSLHRIYEVRIDG